MPFIWAWLCSHGFTNRPISCANLRYYLHEMNMNLAAAVLLRVPSGVNGLLSVGFAGSLGFKLEHM